MRNKEIKQFYIMNEERKKNVYREWKVDIEIYYTAKYANAVFTQSSENTFTSIKWWESCL